jgi:predicted DNA-binding ribbon-helix-helix protein
VEVIFTLDLPKEVFDFLKEVAEEDEVPITSVVKELLNEGLTRRLVAQMAR